MVKGSSVFPSRSWYLPQMNRGASFSPSAVTMAWVYEIHGTMEKRKRSGPKAVFWAFYKFLVVVSVLIVFVLNIIIPKDDTPED